MARCSLLLFIIFFQNLHTLTAQEHADRYVRETDPLVAQKLAEWQDLKFGLLMHWGPYSQWGIVESWSICPEDEGWCRRSVADYQAYVRDYEALQTTFNPVAFDPARWAQAAREAGMRYVVFTTKHHDGFCMYDSRYTDYKITDPKTPFHTQARADVAREIFNAFRAEGLWAGAYFSKPDWHHDAYWWPNFPPRDRHVNYDPAAYPDRWKEYVQFTHNQILELVENYGPLDLLWLDGGWVRKRTHEELQADYAEALRQSPTGYLKQNFIDQDIRMDELVAQCRQRRPGLIVVDRAVPGRHQNYLTPENRVPAEALPYPWESCIISGGGWSYTPKAKYMSGRQGVHLLVDIVAKGGNLLLNIAPSPEGTWQDGAYALLREYADWMRVNSEAIYATHALAPYKEGRVCMTQGRDGAVYFIYLADENEALPASITIGAHRPARGATVTLLGSKTPLKWKAEGERGFSVAIPKALQAAPPCRYAWVVKVSGVAPSAE